MPEINQDLIKKALGLTGRTMDSVLEDDGYGNVEFSFPKFFYYLLSPEFIEKYTYAIRKELLGYITDRQRWQAQHFGNAIYEFQLGNIEPLTQLLKKI